MRALQFWRDTTGQDLIEYVLLIAFVALSIGALLFHGEISIHQIRGAASGVFFWAAATTALLWIATAAFLNLLDRRRFRKARMVMQDGPAGKHADHRRWLVAYADFVNLMFAFCFVMFATAASDKAHATATLESVREALSGHLLARPLLTIIALLIPVGSLLVVSKILRQRRKSTTLSPTCRRTRRRRSPR